MAHGWSGRFQFQGLSSPLRTAQLAPSWPKTQPSGSPSASPSPLPSPSYPCALCHHTLCWATLSIHPSRQIHPLCRHQLPIAPLLQQQPGRSCLRCEPGHSPPCSTLLSMAPDQASAPQPRTAPPVAHFCPFLSSGGLALSPWALSHQLPSAQERVPLHYCRVPEHSRWLLSSVTSSRKPSCPPG